jgi:hypothetical protein
VPSHERRRRSICRGADFDDHQSVRSAIADEGSAAAATAAEPTRHGGISLRALRDPPTPPRRAENAAFT